jgi:DNA (cytosine-5)-methyltransferase 1
MVHNGTDEEEELEDLADGYEALSDEEGTIDTPNEQSPLPLLPETKLLKQVVQPQFIYPRSLYSYYEPPLEECKEEVAVKELCEEIARQEVAQQPVGDELSADGNEFTEIDLSDFSVYLPGDFFRIPYQLRGLQFLNASKGHSELRFDGILSVGGTRRYVQEVPFDICSIGNYGEVHHEVGDDIWIQSTYNRKTNVYYKLRNPAPQYARFHDGFLWLADLAKHFVDFCKASKKPATIYDFRSDFAVWLGKMHGKSPAFKSWYSKYGRDDFRHALCRNIEFIHKESIGVYDMVRYNFMSESHF